MILNDL